MQSANPQAVFGRALLTAIIVVASPVHAASPDRAFLEYLAGMVEEDGEWVDPLAMAELEDSEATDQVSMPLSTDARGESAAMVESESLGASIAARDEDEDEEGKTSEEKVVEQ
ncbi:MAG: hypothetical protein AAF525_03800 [Pseudomonadota bacterium]